MFSQSMVRSRQRNSLYQRLSDENTVEGVFVNRRETVDDVLTADWQFTVARCRAMLAEARTGRLDLKSSRPNHV